MTKDKIDEALHNASIIRELSGVLGVPRERIIDHITELKSKLESVKSQFKNWPSGKWIQAGKVQVCYWDFWENPDQYDIGCWAQSMLSGATPVVAIAIERRRDHRQFVCMAGPNVFEHTGLDLGAAMDEIFKTKAIKGMAKLAYARGAIIAPWMSSDDFAAVVAGRIAAYTAWMVKDEDGWHQAGKA